MVLTQPEQPHRLRVRLRVATPLGLTADPRERRHHLGRREGARAHRGAAARHPLGRARVVEARLRACWGKWAW